MDENINKKHNGYTKNQGSRDYKSKTSKNGKKKYYSYNKRYVTKEEYRSSVITNDKWMEYIKDSSDELIEMCVKYVEAYAKSCDLSKIRIEDYVQGRDHSIEDFALKYIKSNVRHMDDSLKLAHISMKWGTGRGLYNQCVYFLKIKYNLPINNINYKACERSFKPSFQALHGMIRYESELYFRDGILENENFNILKMKCKEEDNRLSSLILHEIPSSMPEIYPMARSISRHFILHIGPTNSGKTYQALQSLKRANTGVYLAPLRLLAYEIYDRMNNEGVICNMITGEEEIIIPEANHTASTIEAMSISSEYDVAVIDECQLIGERQRGGAWTKALLGLCAHIIHVCSDESCVDLVIKIIKECGDTYEIVRHERNTKLVCDKQEDFVFPGSVKEHDALIVFSKRACIAVAAQLQDAGIKASMIYGNLPYDVRLSEVKRFISGETKVVVATDAIGMGLNLPIKRIVFLETRKFDGDEIRTLSVTEIKQIAGRAGRRGMYEEGLYTSEFHKNIIVKAMEGRLPRIAKARIGLPESIIYLDMPLSEIMNRWSNLVTEDIYEKADLQEDIRLCMTLEPVVEDKKVLYDFIMIGFRTGKAFLTDLILECAQIEVGNHDLYDKQIEELIDKNAVLYDDILDEMDMEELENLYLKYDLIYAYLRKFNHRKWLTGIMELKRECSKKIINLLKNQKLEARKCKCCKKTIAWNYPFSICSECFNNQKQRKQEIF